MTNENKKPKTDSEKLAEALKRIELLEQQTIAKFDDGTEMHSIAHVTRDRSTPQGLNPALASFYAAKQSEWKTHPHTEVWARRNGYRRAQSGDFVEDGGLTPSELFDIAEGAYADLVLFVCSKEHQQRRQRDAEKRSAIASNAPLPEFTGPDGNATVR